MSNQPLQEDELRRKVSKMCEGIAAGYHGEDGVDYIMQLIKAYSEQKALEAQNELIGFVHRELGERKVADAMKQYQLTNNQAVLNRRGGDA